MDRKTDMDRRIKRNRMFHRVATIAGFAAIAYLLRRTGANWKTSLTVACLVVWVVWTFIFARIFVGGIRDLKNLYVDENGRIRSKSKPTS